MGPTAGRQAAALFSGGDFDGVLALGPYLRVAAAGCAPGGPDSGPRGLVNGVHMPVSGGGERRRRGGARSVRVAVRCLAWRESCP